MKTAIITGASSGLGKEFVELLDTYYPEVECVWLIARRVDRLQELSDKIRATAVCYPFDLTRDEDIGVLTRTLSTEKPEVQLLINCAGCGYLGDVQDTEPEKLARMTDLNIRALTLVTNAVLPYMAEGGHIVNVSSIASFCPNPRMTVYSSTKAYVSSFSLGLREELRDRKIAVTAVCPGPMATEFLDVGGITGNSQMFKMLPYSDPKMVAEGSLKAVKADQAFHTPKALFKVYRVLAKLIPHALLVKFTKT